MRTKFICGNWKMNGTLEETRTLLQGIINGWQDEYRKVEVAVCPPFTSLAVTQELIGLIPVQFGAQNCHYESRGAFTGEISATMLAETGCSYVILGHSERRTYFHESNELINKKLRTVLNTGLRAILCIGETLEEREAGKTEEVLKVQLHSALAGISSEELFYVTIAYEPVWAIGTGKTATPEIAQAAHQFIRKEIAVIYDQAVADTIIIQYGGSMNDKNAYELLQQPDIDGGLIGGAALKADSFLAIVNSAARVLA